LAAVSEALEVEDFEVLVGDQVNVEGLVGLALRGEVVQLELDFLAVLV